MAFIRKKNVEMDGISVPISPLLSLEVDEFLAKQQEVLSDPDKDEVKKYEILRASWLQFIVSGLNRAAGKDSFTVESIQADFDKVFLEKLRDQMMEMSGVGVAGEVKAPSISPS